MAMRRPCEKESRKVSTKRPPYKVCCQCTSLTLLATPKPDQTIGWSAKLFPHRDALATLKHFAYPVTQTPHLLFPFFTVEGKGDQGNLKVLRLQNLWNAAAMLRNLQQVRKAAGKEQSFYNKIQAITLELTTESIEICYYWAVQDEVGVVRYYGQAVNC